MGRHHGLPTRCVDWSRSSLTALFFACNGELSEDGVVWWVALSDVYSAGASRWQQCFGKTERVEDDIETDFLNGIEKPWITYMEYPSEMMRPACQHAIVTLTGESCVDHAKILAEHGATTCGRVLVPAEKKAQVLEQLKRFGRSSAALGLDRCELEDIAEKCKYSVK